MADQNKNTGTPASGTTNKPGNTNISGGQGATEKPEQGAPRSPNHEQGREHMPNVDAQKDAADTRRTADQSHVPSATTDKAPEPSANDRKDNDADDTMRTTAVGQTDHETGDRPAKLVAGGDSSGKN